MIPQTVPWRSFRQSLDWRQGEHVLLVAPTGGGKTTMARELLPMRSHVAVLATKRRDETLDRFRGDGYKRVRELQDWVPRAIVHPPFPNDPQKMFAAHEAVFRKALSRAYRDGGWTVYADELRYLTSKLKLQDLIEILLLQGRSLGVSVMASTQRPRHIPLEFYDQSTHLFFWRDTDRQNVERVAEIGGNLDKRVIMDRLPHLPPYQFLYVNTRDDTVLESKVDI